MDSAQMFWGLVLKPEKRYEQSVEEPFHISKACLEPNGKGGVTSVFIEVENDEFLVCNLQEKNLNESLDLNFNSGDKICFKTSGNGTVHLTGYNLNDADDLDCEEISDDDSSKEEEEDVMPNLVDKKRKKSDDSLEKPSPKKAKDSKMSPIDKLLAEQRKATDKKTDDLRKKILEAAEKRNDKSKADNDKKKTKESGDDKNDQKSEDESDSDDDDYLINDEAEEADSDEESEEEEEEDGEEEEADSGEEEESDDEEMEVESPKFATPKKEKNKKEKNGMSPKNTEKIANGATPKNVDKSKKNAVETPNSAKKPASKDGKQTPKNAVVDSPVKKPAAEENLTDSAKKEKKNKNKNKAEASPNKPAAVQTPGKTPKKTLKGGLIVEDIKVGNGPEAKRNKVVGMYYEGKLKSNNKTFDSTKSGKPFKFRLGQGEVIKGWDIGLEGMKVGGKRRLTIPANLAYGASGAAPEIPPNATLVFDVECKAVH